MYDMYDVRTGIAAVAAAPNRRLQKHSEARLQYWTPIKSNNSEMLVEGRSSLAYCLREMVHVMYNKTP